MEKIVALDIETTDPAIAKGHSYKYTGFKLLDIGYSYFDDNGVLVSGHISFLPDYKKGIEELHHFLDKHNFDKCVYHNAPYDLARITYKGYDLFKYKYSDTMLLSNFEQQKKDTHKLAYLCKYYGLKLKKLSDEDFWNDILQELKEFLIKSNFRLSSLFNDKIITENQALELILKKKFNLQITNIKTNLEIIRKHFNKSYMTYLTGDTEATLLLYYHIKDLIVTQSAEQQKHNPILISGKTTLDLLATEEFLIPYDVQMSMTEIPIDKEKLKVVYDTALEKVEEVKQFYPELFKINLNNNYTRYKEANAEIDPSVCLSNFLKEVINKMNLSKNRYPKLFYLDKEEIVEAIKLLDNKDLLEKEALDYLKSNVYFTEYDFAVTKRPFKLLLTKYLNKYSELEDKKDLNGLFYINKDMIGGYIRFFADKDDVTVRKLLDFVKQFNSVNTVLTKFILPFYTAVQEKGGLYSEMIGYRSVKEDSKNDKDGNQGTITGRMSASKYNVMTIPRDTSDELNNVKSYFRPRSENFEKQGYKGGYKLVYIDWKAQELRLMVLMSNHKELMAKYKEDPDHDIHQAVADMLNGEKKKDDEGYIIRDVAKTINFALPYNMTPHTLATVRLPTYPKEEVAKFYEAVLSKNTELKELYDKAFLITERTGYVTTMWGRPYKPTIPLDVFGMQDLAPYFAIGKELTMEHKKQIMSKYNKKMYAEYGEILEHPQPIALYNKLKQDLKRFHLDKYFGDLEESLLPPIKEMKESFDNICQGKYPSRSIEECFFLLYNRSKKQVKERDLTADFVAYIIFYTTSKIKSLGNKFAIMNLLYDCRDKGDVFDSSKKKNFGADSINKFLNSWTNWEETSGYNNENGLQRMKFSIVWRILDFAIKEIYDYMKKTVNAYCQGSGADMLKESRKKLMLKGYTDPNSPEFIADVLFPIHDALLLTMKDDEHLEENIAKIVKVMEWKIGGMIFRVDTAVMDVWEK